MVREHQRWHALDVSLKEFADVVSFRSRDDYSSLAIGDQKESAVNLRR